MSKKWLLLQIDFLNILNLYIFKRRPLRSSCSYCSWTDYWSTAFNNSASYCSKSIVNNAKIANFFKAQSKHFVLIKLVIRINAKDRDTLKSKKKIQMCEKQVWHLITLALLLRAWQIVIMTCKNLLNSLFLTNFKLFWLFHHCGIFTLSCLNVKFEKTMTDLL